MPVGPALKESFPEVQAASTVRAITGTMSYEDMHFREEQMYMVMPDFFEMFSFPIIQGNPIEKFSEPNQAMVSVSTAEKYFGEEDPVGKTIHLNDRNDFIIVGVFEDIPENTHMKFNWLFSYQTFVNWKWPICTISGYYNTIHFIHCMG